MLRALYQAEDQSKLASALDCGDPEITDGCLYTHGAGNFPEASRYPNMSLVRLFIITMSALIRLVDAARIVWAWSMDSL
jgi:hypothetical protein